MVKKFIEKLLGKLYLKIEQYLWDESEHRDVLADKVSDLKFENESLKELVEELEGTIEHLDDRRYRYMDYPR